MMQDILSMIFAYILLRLVFYKIHRNDIISACIISSISCWDFVINNNLDRLEKYYIYSIIISCWHLDILMIAHHILVLYTMYRVNTPDRELAMTLLRYAKISDIFAHVNKLCQYAKQTNLLEHIRLISILITIVLWVIFRVCYIIYTFNSIQTYEAMIAIMIFATFTVWWIYKLCMLFIRLM